MQRWNLFFLCSCAEVEWTLILKGERPPAQTRCSLQEQLPSPKEALDFCAAAHSVFWTSGIVNTFVMSMTLQANLCWRTREPLYSIFNGLPDLFLLSPPWLASFLYIVITKLCQVVTAFYIGQVVRALYMVEQKTYFCYSLKIGAEQIHMWVSFMEFDKATWVTDKILFDTVSRCGFGGWC